MKNSIILNDTQVNRLQQTGTVTVVEMVKPQPVNEQCKMHTILDTTGPKKDVGKHFWGISDGYSIRYRSELFQSPYTTGSTVYVREAYSKLDKSHYIDRWFVYKAEMDRESEYIRAGYPYQWTPASRMPKYAKQVCIELTPEQKKQLNMNTSEYVSDVFIIVEPLKTEQ